MKTVLVTGASGFLGQVVVRQLMEQGAYKVAAVISGRRAVSFPEGVETEVCNLLDEQERTALVERVKPDILCHLAWGQETSDYRSSASNLQWLEASCSLLRIFSACKGQRFVFAGSCTEYDDYSGKAEEEPQKQRMSLYGECKRAFYHVMRNYCTIANMRYVDARIFTVYGEGDTHKFGAIPSTINAFLHKQPVVCKSPNTIRDYIYIEDAARAVVMLAENDYCGAVNVSNGFPLSMRFIFSAIAEKMDCRALLSFENEDECSQVLVGDNNILKKLGMESFTPFEIGIRKTIQWWKVKVQKHEV